MNRLSLIFLFSIPFMISSSFLYGQERKVIQFSGLIYATGTNITVPYVTVRNLSYNNQIVHSNHEGYFSFVVHAGDTIQFSSVGYSTTTYMIPNLQGDDHTARIKLASLVEELPEVTIGPPLPWASIEEFTLEFLSLDPSGDGVSTAQRNLSPEAIASLARILPRSAGEIHSYNSGQRHLNMTNKNINQRFANPLLNPFAWGSLINQIKSGDFSRKKLKY